MTWHDPHTAKYFPSGLNLATATGALKLKWCSATPSRKLARIACPSVVGRHESYDTGNPVSGFLLFFQFYFRATSGSALDTAGHPRPIGIVLKKIGLPPHHPRAGLRMASKQNNGMRRADWLEPTVPSSMVRSVAPLGDSTTVWMFLRFSNASVWDVLLWKHGKKSRRYKGAAPFRKFLAQNHDSCCHDNHHRR
jgi:hypothetical protein